MRTIVVPEKLNAKNVEKSRITKPKREKQADTEFKKKVAPARRTFEFYNAVF